LDRIVLPEVDRPDSSQVYMTLGEVDLLAELMRTVRPALIVVDPVQSFLGGKIDDHKVTELRPVLDGLARLAHRYSVAVLLIAHLKKGASPQAVHRIQGSTDYGNSARSVLMAAETGGERSGSCTLVHAKCNLGKRGTALGYELGGETGFTWLGPSEATSEDLFPDERRPRRAPSKTKAAKVWLEELLTDHGPMPAAQVQAAGEEEGYSQRTISRAKGWLEVESKPQPREEGRGASRW